MLSTNLIRSVTSKMTSPLVYRSARTRWWGRTRCLIQRTHGYLMIAALLRFWEVSLRTVD